MTALTLHPDALAAKHATIKAWRDSQSQRPETLTGWTITRAQDGLLHVSAQLSGPDPAAALTAFAARQASFLTIRANPCGEDLLPVLDFTVPGRTAAVWRLDGVWVEVWHPDPAPTAHGPVQAVLRPVSVRRPLGRPGARLPFTRRSRKETTA
ncbi:hypothetical protein [Streptomyces seoulensis]|uniref:hypothetical protein n=1 Tax=Streptomyces seoulensis TaxID=73044 RepID=UPI0004CD5BE5|nr:hypothetical protein [Streptomyces seoulensis]